MQDAVALVAEAVKTEFTGVGVVLADGETLLVKVTATDERGTPRDPQSYETSLDPRASMAGYAFNTANPVVTSDLPSEKRFADPFLRKLGVIAALTVPLHVGGKPFGAFGVYTKAGREFAPDEVRFAETIAQLLTSSVTRVRFEEKLARQQTFVSTVLGTVDALVLTLDLEDKVVDINPACRRITGFSLGDVRNRPFWNVFIASNDVELVRKTFRNVKTTKVPQRFSSALMTKDGNKKWVAWSLDVVSDPSGQVQFVVLTGLDRTKQVETEAKLRQLEEAAQPDAQAPEALRSAAGADDPPERVPRRPTGESSADPSVAEKARPQPPREPVGGATSRELRRAPRRVYHYRQKIAPLYDARPPAPEDFYEVVCKDISAGGLAFICDYPPDFHEMVVVLGAPPVETYFKARIVRVMPQQKENGRAEYLVGCQFTGRIRL